jgi:hypothetical protein
VIVTVPTATPVTTPLDETVAMFALLVDQVIGASLTTLPSGSRAVAVKVVVHATFTLTDEGDTLTLATGSGPGTVTVTVADPLWPSLLAVMVAVPAATPVTTPVDETVAIAGALVDHPTMRPNRTFPLASRVVAVRVTVSPTSTLAVVGATVTLATDTARSPWPSPVFRRWSR